MKTKQNLFNKKTIQERKTKLSMVYQEAEYNPIHQRNQMPT